MENKTHFSLWVFDCDVQDALLFLVSLISMKHDLPSFQILVNKIESSKGQHFLVGCGRHLTSLGQWVKAQHGGSKTFRFGQNV